MIKSDLSQKFVCPTVVESDKIRRHLTQADLSYLDATWTWGCLPSCQAIGTERLSLASFKVQTSGTRRVLLADVEGVYNFVKKGAAHGSQILMSHCLELLVYCESSCGCPGFHVHRLGGTRARHFLPLGIHLCGARGKSNRCVWKYVG